MHSCRCQYSTIPLTRSSGLYFEHVKNVKLLESHWNLVTYINLSIFNKKIRFIENSYKETESLCLSNFTKTTNFNLCDTSLIAIGKLIPSLYKKETTLKTLMSRTNREKRGWFNFVGSTLKTVFGTLDQNDADFYNKAITKASKDEKHLIDLLKQQVQVVKSTISNFNHTMSDLNKNKDIYNVNFQKLANYSQIINKNYFSLELKQTLDNHFNLLTLLISELETEFTNIIDTILFAKSNVLHPFVITPVHIIKELSKTNTYLRS